MWPILGRTRVPGNILRPSPLLLLRAVARLRFPSFDSAEPFLHPETVVETLIFCGSLPSPYGYSSEIRVHEAVPCFPGFPGHSVVLFVHPLTPFKWSPTTPPFI